jgi:CubicO group peptidase (beta-lactamase class C family)
LPQPEAELERQIRTLQAEKRLPSVSAAVFRGRELVWQFAVGLADAEQGIEATPDTQYRVGSITKTFTAAAILQLRDAGELDIGAPIAEHVPELHDRRATIKDALSHASGLQREEPGAEWEPIGFIERDELLRRLGEVERVLEPRDEWHYSNLAYALLGEIVARVSGEPYEQYVEERLFTPAGLERTTWEPAQAAAVGYHNEPWTDVVHVEDPVDLRGGRPAGQLWSTAGDLARWGAFLHDPPPDALRPETAAEMRRVQTVADHRTWRLASGLGLILYRSGDRVFAGHSGGMNGFLANLAFEAYGETGAVILTNTSGAQFSVDNAGIELAVKAAELVAPAPESWRPGEGPPPELEGVLGNWWTEGWEFIFTYRGGKLRAGAVGSRFEPAVFEPDGPDRYRTVSGRERGELLEIIRDDEGRAVKMTWATYPLTRTSLPMS